MGYLYLYLYLYLSALVTVSITSLRAPRARRLPWLLLLLLLVGCSSISKQPVLLGLAVLHNRASRVVAVLTFQRFPCRLCAVSRSIYRTVDARVYCSIIAGLRDPRSSDVAIRLPLSVCRAADQCGCDDEQKKIKQAVHESILSSFTSS